MATKEFSNVVIGLSFTEATSDVTVAGGNNHASNIDGDPNEQDLALALGKIQNWFNNWHSVVWTGDAAKVNGHTVEHNVPSDALFTDTTYALSGAYGTGNDTYVITLTPSSGSATTATVPKATTSAFGITKLSTSTSSTADNLAATPSAVKSAYDLAAGKSTVAFTQTLSSGSEVGTLTIDGTDVKLYAPAGTGNDKVTQNIKSDNKNYPLLLSYYETSSSTTTAEAANRATGIYANPSTGTITATNFVGTINGYTIGGNVETAVPPNALFTDTTYTFATGTTNGTFNVSVNGGTATPVSVYGLGTAAYANTSAFVSTKPDGTTDFMDSNHIINSVYLPSYVDDVVEGYYDYTYELTTSQPADWTTNYTSYYTKSGNDYIPVTGDTAPTWAANTYYKAIGHFYTTSAHTTEITPSTDKIYVDISDSIKADGPTYRWSGSQYISLKSPTVHAIANIVQKSNGVITKSFTDGSADADVTVYTHPTTAGNKHIPQGGAADQILAYSASGTAHWIYLNQLGANSNSDYTGATANAAGVHGLVPAAAAGQNAAYYLRGDGTWSNDPVIPADTLHLHVIAGSSS